MSARTDLGDLIGASAPDTWEIYPYPVTLGPLDDPAKPVAVVIEQRGIESGPFSPDANAIPTEVELAVWVMVDATRGDRPGVIEDDLEAAAETMIQILEPLPEHVWNGTGQRDAYDQQKPAYQFTISAAGALTPEE